MGEPLDKNTLRYTGCAYKCSLMWAENIYKKWLNFIRNGKKTADSWSVYGLIPLILLVFSLISRSVLARKFLCMRISGSELSLLPVELRVLSRNDLT